MPFTSVLISNAHCAKLPGKHDSEVELSEKQSRVILRTHRVIV